MCCIYMPKDSACASIVTSVECVPGFMQRGSVVLFG